MAATKASNLLREWQRWWTVAAFVKALFKSRRSDVSAHHR
jgi:hypothetical protein